MAVVEGGRSATTRIEVLERWERADLLRVALKTGRTHQIRVHLDSVGHPILGDRIYGQPPEVFLSLYEERSMEGRDALLGHPRHCLHARAITLPHPDGGNLTVKAPLPDDFLPLLGTFRPPYEGS